MLPAAYGLAVAYDGQENKAAPGGQETDSMTSHTTRSQLPDLNALPEDIRIKIKDTDFTALHSLGFDDEEIWDIAGITAFFGFSNRMANVTSMMPNPEFYLLDRVPKQK